jgi:hypothetical protein
MNVSLIAPSDERWTALLACQEHDFHHLPSFVALEAERSGGEGAALFLEQAGHQLLIPLVLRDLPEHLGVAGRDAISPYGYPCPLLSGPDSEVHTQLLTAVPAALSEVGLISAFVRLHPLIATPLEALAEAGELVRHGPTVWIDLTESVEEMWRQTRSSDRNRMNKLRRQGYAARVDTEWARIDDFVALYNETMGYLSASAGYFYDRAYFEALKAALDGRLHLCLVEGPDEAVVSAGVFSEIGDMIQFHLSGTREDHRRTSPSRLMLDRMRRVGKERGATRFHLGGGVGAAEDSLYEFKRGFSSHRAEFHTWRVLGDPQRYAEAEAAARAAGAAEGSDGFFPSYRRPIAS